MRKSAPPHSQDVPPQPSSTAVARLAGVSQATVSRVFSDTGAAVSPALRKRVHAAAATLGYTPNVLPGILQTGRSGLVGVVLDSFFCADVAEQLTQLAASLRTKKLEMIVTQRIDGESLQDAIERLSRYRIDEIVSLCPVQTMSSRKRSRPRVVSPTP